MDSRQLSTFKILGLTVHTGEINNFISSIVSLAKMNVGSYVCFINAHMAVESSKDPKFKDNINNADLVCPDGISIAKSISWISRRPQERVSGPEMLPILLGEAMKYELHIFVLGGTENVLADFVKKANREFPGVICGSYSPPFRALTEAENSDIVRRINDSKANIVFVSLGCPKQEKWMAMHRGAVNACMLGLGYAITVYADHAKRAPHWMQKAGLEWLHRLKNDPQKLWKRYLYTNTTFIWKMICEILTQITSRSKFRI